MIRKAIIPVAGLGTRMFPVARVTPKAMLPLVRGGRIRTVLHWILAEVHAAGIAEAAIVASPSQMAMLRQYLDVARETLDNDLPPRVELLEQTSPLGFGDAVLQAQPFVGREPFAILLGDHVYVELPGSKPCIRQAVEAFETFGGAAMIGVQGVPESELRLVGAMAGEQVRDNIYRCTDFLEKPDVESARRRLRTPGLPVGQYLAHCGIYLFSAEILDHIERLYAAPRLHGKEVQLADAQELLLKAHPKEYYLCAIRGRGLDMGTPAGYAATVAAFSQS